MSMLLTLFKATKKLYEDFEASRWGANIPFARSHKAFLLDDNQVPNPKEDQAVIEVINKLAQDAKIDETTHLKNLVQILHTVISQDSSQEQIEKLATLRSDNKKLFEQTPSFNDYNLALYNFIERKLEIEQHAAERSRLLADNSILTSANAALQQDLMAATQEVVNIDYRNEQLVARKQRHAATIVDLRIGTKQLQTKFEEVEASNAETLQALNVAEYNLEETTSQLKQTSLAKGELEQKFADADKRVTRLQVDIATLRRTHAQKLEKLAADALINDANLKMKTEVNSALSTKHMVLCLERDGLATQLEKLETKLAAEKSSYVALGDQYSILLHDREGLKDELRTSLIDNKHKSAKLETVLSHANNLETKIGGMTDQLQKLKEQIATLTMRATENNEKMKAEKADLQRRMDEATAEIATLTTKLKKRSDDLAAVTDQKKKIEAQAKNKDTQQSAVLKTLTADVEELTKAKASVDAALKAEMEKTKAATAIVKKFKDAESRIKELEKSLKTLDDVHGQINNSYVALQAENNSLSAQIAVLSSSSEKDSTDKLELSYLTQSKAELEKELALAKADKLALSGQLAKLQGKQSSNDSKASATVSNTSQTLFAASKAKPASPAANPQPSTPSQRKSR